MSRYLLQHTLDTEYIFRIHEKSLPLHYQDDTVNDTVKHEVSSLSKTENAVFAAIRKYPSYSYEQFADYCGFSRPTIARTIKSLQSKGLIRRVGSDKTGHWEL